MKKWFLTGETIVLRAWAIVGAIAGLCGVAVSLYLYFSRPEELEKILPRAEEGTPPIELACDSASEVISGRILSGLSGMDCDLAQIKICAFQESTKPGGETSHGLPSHFMQISAQLPGERIPVIGSGRGSHAELTAFDTLFNNLRLVLEEKNLCR